MDRITSSITGQQQAPPPDAGQQKVTPLPPPIDPADNRMDMGQQEMEPSQDDISMGDSNGVQMEDDSGAVKTKEA